MNTFTLDTLSAFRFKYSRTFTFLNEGLEYFYTVVLIFLMQYHYQQDRAFF